MSGTAAAQKPLGALGLGEGGLEDEDGPGGLGSEVAVRTLLGGQDGRGDLGVGDGHHAPRWLRRWVGR